MARLLFVQLPNKTLASAPAEAHSEPAQSAERAFSWSLLFSGVRCVLQYALLPFFLPLIGLAGDFSVAISLTINIVAIIAIVFSLRRFWQIDYRRKWQYLPVALVALVMLVAFIILDVQHLLVA